MNYFAHLALARPTAASKVGNLMGDFMRGVREETLPEPVRRGLHNHRLVDRFTDHYPQVVESRALFSPGRRRFAGVALDVVFDHFLLRHWERFHDEPLEPAIERDYRLLREGRGWMPETMRLTTGRMVEHDWVRAYQNLDTVGLALDRIAARVRFRNGFQGMIEEIEPLHDHLEAVFLGFYPELRRAVAVQGLEAA